MGGHENKINKIYDCFLFNDELDLLLTRLEYLYEYVDYFVIVESDKTFTNKPKNKNYKQNENLFHKFKNKIIYNLFSGNKNVDNPWVNEANQRRYLLECINFKDDDIIIISDLDEIPNHVLLSRHLNRVYRLKMYLSLYFFNNVVDTYWKKAVIGPYKELKKYDIGLRDRFLSDIKSFKGDNTNIGGWHLSYLFGDDYTKYENKIQSFSHQEYNKPHYYNQSKLEKKLRFGLDIFTRKGERTFIVKPQACFSKDFYSVLIKRFPEDKFRLSKVRLSELIKIKNILYTVRYIRNNLSRKYISHL